MGSGIIALCVGSSLLIGIVVGIMVTRLLTRNQTTASIETLEKTYRERIQEKDTALAAIETARRAKEEEASGLRAQLATAQEQAQSASREKDQVERQLPETFAALSGQALKEANQELLKLANENQAKGQAAAKAELDKKELAIETLVKPIQVNLEKLEKQCNELETKREVAYSNIEKHVTGMMMAAGQLSNALKKPTVRGSWGEMTLRTVVENAGLQEGVHFEVQHSTETDDGRLRADMVINLPKNRRIAMDSKSPLDAFREAVNCENEIERDGHFKRHAAHVRGHMKALAEKRYWNQYQGVDIVIMFLPSEAMFYTAVEHDKALLDDARNDRIYLANPSTLMAMLSAIAYILDQERLNDSALEISKIGRNLHDGVRAFAGHMGKVGRNLRLSVDSYNDSVRSLERSVLSRSRQLHERGVGGDDIGELDEVAVLPIGFQSQELIAAGIDAVNDLPQIEKAHQQTEVPLLEAVDSPLLVQS